MKKTVFLKTINASRSLQTTVKHKRRYSVPLVFSLSAVVVTLQFTSLRCATSGSNTACCSLCPTVFRQSLFVFETVHRSWSLWAVCCLTVVRLSCCEGFHLTQICVKWNCRIFQFRFASSCWTQAAAAGFRNWCSYNILQLGGWSKC